ncbi:related to DNA repair protein rad8 [Rhynchosporium agropyri]|uniref:Related to DNA repair protein rad8 n=1 Tax=Rhynchosporium agropyri TaxID=914238 RepID=A0A1E1L4E3_9HELO|nr:related to DNA repair protein rad8 [Rhynchosporium agropyri]
MDSAFEFGLTKTCLFPDYSKIDIDKYIAAGCLRISQPESNISIDAWRKCSSWQKLAHSLEANESSQISDVEIALRESILHTSLLRPFRSLCMSQWIRLEFRINDYIHGQVRVYILPDDVGRSVIDRDVPALRKNLLLLLSQLDISPSTWSGRWTQDSPTRHVEPSLDSDRATGEDPSLFQIFNTLPSPNPDPRSVPDVHARNAMNQILDGSIAGMRTVMYDYQRRSAALMLQRETKPEYLLDPRLRYLVDRSGNNWYCDSDSGSCFREPRTYEAPRGGICAETMGLGKTLICLGLIMSTRDVTSQIPEEYLEGTFPLRKKTASLLTMAAATLGRRAFPWRDQLARREAEEGYLFDRCREALAKSAGSYMIAPSGPRRKSRNPTVSRPRKILLTPATIVVAPANLIQQWQHEIKKHTTGLAVLVVKAMSDVLPTAKELAEFDIILFSKQRFEKEAAIDVDVSPNSPLFRSKSRHTILNGGLFGRVSTGSDNFRCSPLKELHFKRLIVDEGHTFGNLSSSSRTEASAVLDFLQVSARWIVSGTPTKGLYGAESGIGSSQSTSPENTPSSARTPSNDEGVSPKGLSAILGSSAPENSPQTSGKDLNLFHKQERNDIEKLGNIATSYLKARPWANQREDKDFASWSRLIMQPRHGSKSRGNLDCLRATLEGMIIRHRQEDIELEVTLPPLHQKHVFLEGSLYNKLSLNTFSMMIIGNAVTSERKDADYFFHPRQRKNLQQLVSNMRQGSFFWSGFETHNIQSAIENNKDFLAANNTISREDEDSLLEAIKHGNNVLNNRIARVIFAFHEMPIHVKNDLADDIRAAWSLTGEPVNPTLMGATMVHAAQNFVGLQLYKEDPTEGLLKEGENIMHDARMGSAPQITRSRKRPAASQDEGGVRKRIAKAPTLAGNVTMGSESNLRKRARTTVKTSSWGSKLNVSNYTDLLTSQGIDDDHEDYEDDACIQRQLDVQLKPNSALKISTKLDISGTLHPSSSLATARIISTASSKLSYLMDRVSIYSPTEKILIFYEADNIAYYIAQGLECLGIKHLIYAKSLSSARRSQYVVTFNQSEVFRVLLMDVSQAAFGLDISSASRVYFVNPVFSPQVEAQAVKRAHRIGQTKPVYVETLVLKGSIEEVILKRRKELSIEEHNSCKNILDDRTMHDWIRNARFLDLETQGIESGREGEAGDELDQMAILETPQLLFGRGGAGAEGRIMDPDQDLIVGDSPKRKDKASGEEKTKIMLATGVKFPAERDDSMSEKAKGKRNVGFVNVGESGDEGSRGSQDNSTSSGSGSGVPVRTRPAKKIRFTES